MSITAEEFARSHPRPQHAAPVAPIQFRDLTKRFGPVTAVDHINCTISSGRVTGFLGPNGAGKTTTLRMLVGLATATEGEALFGDTPYHQLSLPQDEVGVVLEATFHPGRSGRNHLRVLAATAGADDERVDELLELVGLKDAARRTVGGYSLGMRQRLALAGALLGTPDYLILDEPANGLDPEGIRWLRSFLRAYAASGRTVLVSSHMLNEVQATVDDIIVIGRGRLLYQGEMASLDGTEAKVTLRTPDVEKATKVLDGTDWRFASVPDQFGTVFEIATGDPRPVGDALYDGGVRVHELQRVRSNLEESFFRMLEESA